MDLNKLTRGERIVFIAGALLIINLLFLPWHKIDLSSGVLGIDVKATRTGVQSPNGGYGILAVLLTLVMIAQIVAVRFTSAKLPVIPIQWRQVHLIVGGAVAAFLVLKLLVETDYLGIGAFIGLVLGGAVAYGGFLISKEPEVTPGFMP